MSEKFSAGDKVTEVMHRYTPAKIRTVAKSTLLKITLDDGSAWSARHKPSANSQSCLPPRFSA